MRVDWSGMPAPAPRRAQHHDGIMPSEAGAVEAVRRQRQLQEEDRAVERDQAIDDIGES